jgi:hypothetical protein
MNEFIDRKKQNKFEQIAQETDTKKRREKNEEEMKRKKTKKELKRGRIFFKSEKKTNVLVLPCLSPLIQIHGLQKSRAEQSREDHWQRRVREAEHWQRRVREAEHWQNRVGKKRTERKGV